MAERPINGTGSLYCAKQQIRTHEGTHAGTHAGTHVVSEFGWRIRKQTGHGQTMGNKKIQKIQKNTKKRWKMARPLASINRYRNKTRSKTGKKKKKVNRKLGSGKRGNKPWPIENIPGTKIWRAGYPPSRSRSRSLQTRRPSPWTTPCWRPLWRRYASPTRWQSCRVASQPIPRTCGWAKKPKNMSCVKVKSIIITTWLFLLLKRISTN